MRQRVTVSKVDQPDNQAIANLSNLGPKSAEMLAAAGIKHVDQLRQLGSVAAYVKVKSVVPTASLNLLWALEGALTGLTWQQVAHEHRASLLLSLEQLQQQGNSGTEE
jgi:DNA transformation protein and related proteins